jgi:RNA polymerase sigma-70 factor (ECF subfamily)
MAEAPPTRGSLLVRLRDAADGPAWRQFVEIYAPLIFGFFRKKGLQDADAADLTQDILAAVARAIRDFDYDPRKGSFRGWLFTAVRHRLQRFCASPPAQGAGDTTALEQLHQVPAPEEEPAWEEEYERRLFQWAAEQVKPTVAQSTWQAFWQTAVEGKNPRDVGKSLGLAVAAVYMAKSRVLGRLKELIAELEDQADPARSNDNR